MKNRRVIFQTGNRQRSPQSAVLRMKLKGANLAPAVTGEREMDAKTNYFKGNDPHKWHTDVARFARVRYAQVYPGIDMIYYGQQQQLEYDFEVAPGADARQIALEFTGVKQAKIERGTGDLVLQTACGEVRQHKPIAYQEGGAARQEVKSRYVMQGKGRVGIEVGEYDRTQRLVIDPALIYSTYLGGSGEDDGTGIAVDTSGHAYVTGYTFSTDFPTLNEYQTVQANVDAFVTKLDTKASGAASLLYSTYLGGLQTELATAIAVNTSGHAYITGYTTSSDFPTKNQYQGRQGTQEFYGDAFVTKLDTNATGAASLLYSTYLGGRYDDYGNGVAVDTSGNAYITGYTTSSDFPTKNQYQTHQGFADVFVAKINTNVAGAASLLYSTYLGGRYGDYGTGIAVDTSGNAYVTGVAYSYNFPTLNAYQNHGGYYKAFVTKINTKASGAASLRYSTYLGGSGEDYGTGIAVDTSGNAYVTGYTVSPDFPTKNQYRTYHGSGYDAFVTKLMNTTLISGRITSDGKTGIDGVTMTLSGSESRTVVTDATGNYSFLNIQLGGDYTVTPSKSNLNFIPSEKSFTNLQVDRMNVNFTTLHATIGGRVTCDGTTSLSGVTMTVSGSMNLTTVTNSEGNYSAELALGGNYTVTPSKSGFTFDPSAQSLTDFQANQTNLNFTTTCVNISGQITKDTAAGAGLAGQTLFLTSGEDFKLRTAITASDGTYSFIDVPAPRSYEITPSRSNYIFSPTRLVLNDVATDQTGQNFIATLRNYTIGGVVKLGTAGVAGVTVELTSPTPDGFPPRTTTTSSTGAYSFPNVPAIREYTVTPTKTDYQFTPGSISLSPLSSNRLGVSFKVTAYQISGRITSGSSGIGGVTVTITSTTLAGFPARTVQTSSTGQYFSGATLPAGHDYMIEPTKSGYTFTPATRSITNLSNNIPAGAATNFTGTQ